MYSVRKSQNQVGIGCDQVVRYVGHRSIIAKHIGSAKDQIEEAVFASNCIGVDR